MVVYAEYLFLENFITGLIILCFSGRICGVKTGKVRLCTGGALCGLFSFILFVRIPAVPALFIKFAFSAAVIFLTFPLKAVCGKGGIRLLATFYIVSFLLGGLTIAVIYLTGVRGIAGNGYVYMEAPTYISVTVGITAGSLLLGCFARWLRSRVRTEKLQYDVIVQIGEKQFFLSAYTDTGNSLRDPVSRTPVFVISEKGAEGILKMLSDSEIKKRYCVIPFRAAGTEKGLMNGFRADKLILNDGRCFAPAIFAIYEGDFLPKDGQSGFDVLLNKEIVGGGLI